MIEKRSLIPWNGDFIETSDDYYHPLGNTRLSRTFPSVPSISDNASTFVIVALVVAFLLRAALWIYIIYYSQSSTPAAAPGRRDIHVPYPTINFGIR